MSIDEHEEIENGSDRSTPATRRWSTNRQTRWSHHWQPGGPIKWLKIFQSGPMLVAGDTNDKVSLPSPTERCACSDTNMQANNGGLLAQYNISRRRTARELDTRCTTQQNSC
jgi:hypothetical protein